MKRSIIILAACMAALSWTVPALGQNHVRKAMQRSRERQEAMARQIIFNEGGDAKGGYLTYQVENGDTTYFDTLDPIWIFGRKRAKGEKDWKKYYKLVYNFAKVYPYAQASGRLQEIVDSTITAGNYGRMKKDRYISGVQKQLFVDFEGALRSMTISQGAVLLKLIDRETGRSPYSIIKDYKNGVAAGFWNGIAKFFDNDLRSQYDPEGADRDLEELVQMWQAGTFPAFYRSIFWEDPPAVHVPDTYK
ncbi:MAG: DUF4294 domain-containing protein [Bacteroidales bacterium]|nr:DUF4294 domain-containing protein [Bacteroidales bacterium]